MAADRAVDVDVIMVSKMVVVQWQPTVFLVEVDSSID
jgi:hypothetical protein